MDKLKAVEASVALWQKKAIDQIDPYLDELCGYTNADHATDLAAMIGDFAGYGNAKQRVERPGNKLEVPANK